MKEATISFQVEQPLKDQFTTAANACGCSETQLLRDFIQDFVRKQHDSEADSLFRLQVEAGLASANAGNLISSEEVEKEFAVRREATRRKLVTHS